MYTSFSINRNKLVKLYGGEQDFDLGNGWFTGEPINVHYDWNNLGEVWTEEEFFNGEVPDGFFPGYFKVEDIKTSEETLRELGILKGDLSGDLLLDQPLKRQDVIVLLSRLLEFCLDFSP